MGDFIKALLTVVAAICVAACILSFVKGGKVEARRPQNEDAYGWYEYHITHAEDEMERLEYEMGLHSAWSNGSLTDSEYDTLKALAEQEG